VKILELFLGIMSALGGFVDIGELVFMLQAGAKFAYSLLWVIVLGTIGIILFGEMSGRIAAVRRKAVFELVRERMGDQRGLSVLIASNFVNFLTCAAEVGGIAIVLQMLFGGDYRLMIAVSGVLMATVVFSLKFEWLERLFGLLGLGMLVYMAAAISLSPDWGKVARGLLPSLPSGGSPGLVVYAYFVVGIFSAVLMPYEVYFYSSGAIEEKWKPADLPMNMLNSAIGFTLGAFLGMSLVIVGALIYKPMGLDSQLLSTTVLPTAIEFGTKGMLVALVGLLFALGGAAAETALSGAYNVAQFFGLRWSKDDRARDVPVFTATWIALILLGAAVAMSGVNPVMIVEYSVIFAVMVLPFTYYPILRVASSRELMGRHVNRPWVTALGWFYFALITLAAIAAVPLMIASHMGDG
jgi:Mn2+/Fe2+ NRAMP family transporter